MQPNEKYYLIKINDQIYKRTTNINKPYWLNWSIFIDKQ